MVFRSVDVIPQTVLLDLFDRAKDLGDLTVFEDVLMHLDVKRMQCKKVHLLSVISIFNF